MNGIIDYIKLDIKGVSTTVFPRTVTNAIYIGSDTSGKTLDSFISHHQHNMADIIDLNVDNDGNVVFNKLTLLINGNVSATYNGIQPVSLDISLEKLGGAAAGHNHDSTYSKLNHTHGNYATITHTHSMSDITDFSGGGVGEIKPLTIQINGFNQAKFDGTAEQTLDITLDKLGAAATTHTHNIAAIEGFQNLQINLQSGNPIVYNPKVSSTYTLTAESVGAAAVNHDHGYTYAPYGHNHEELYASIRHTHDNAYASKAELEETKKSVADGKSLVAGAISATGVYTAAESTFAVMNTNIRAIRKEKLLFEVGSWHNDFAASAWGTFKGFKGYGGPTNFNSWIRHQAMITTVGIDVTDYDYIEIQKQTWNNEELVYLAVIPENELASYEENIYDVPTFSICEAPRFVSDDDKANGKDIARINVKNLTGRYYLFVQPFNWTGVTNVGLRGLSYYVLNNGATDHIRDSAIQYIYKISLVSHAYFT